MTADRAGDFGSKLRAARERKGVSLRQIANKTKISIAVLEALERNDISRLPGGIFSRAFVRSYAVEVGLDPEKTIEEFIAQFPHDSVTAGHPTSQPVEDYEELESERRAASTVLWIVAVSLLLAGAVIYFTVLRRGATAAPTAPPPASSAAAEPRPEPAPDTATPPPAGAASSGEAAGAATSGPVPVPTPPAAASSGSSGEASSDRLTIGLSARRPVFVSATVDGQRTISRLLQAGESQTIDIKREMVLTAGDAAALTLTLNGAPGRSLGKSQEVVTARINLTNFKDYLAR